ncbi:MAG: 1-deoxy-D-xylulose-5-phosphate reductoisomerase [Spirochaetes bacterium]|nr:1-deoxy-D-xylulose-5-phosphate reductoisomerase [Spirochaetota bacterium]
MKHPKERRVFLLGSTGSIGSNTLDCIRQLEARPGAGKFRVVGLAAGNDGATLSEQVRAVNPKVAYLRNEAGARRLSEEFPDLEVHTGERGLLQAMAAVKFDLCVNALVGSAGLVPTLYAIDRGADIALANKETLIMAGHLVMERVKKRGVSLLPIDSEHSAIFHLLKGIRRKEIHRLVLTASGGPFWNKELGDPTLEEALAHPTWKMGKKISIDSATMMNKGFEVIEAHWLFKVPFPRIDTVIHPQSIVHSMVETVDGEIYAQLGPNDMRHPIQNALTHPHLLETPLKRLRLEDLGQLAFHPMDLGKFPLLGLAYACGERGGSSLAVLNAANEAAVGLFLEKAIRFRQIHELVARALDAHRDIVQPDLETILDLDRSVKEQVRVWGQSGA